MALGFLGSSDLADGRWHETNRPKTPGQPVWIEGREALGSASEVKFHVAGIPTAWKALVSCGLGSERGKDLEQQIWPGITVSKGTEREGHFTLWSLFKWLGSRTPSSEFEST